MKLKKQLNEIKKEDDLYFNGCFWIVAESFKDILIGNFKLEGIRYLVNDDGDEISETPVKAKIHQNVWENNYKNNYKCSYMYFPRGRVSHYKGITYININPKINTPEIIDKIFEYYDLNKELLKEKKNLGNEK